MTVGHEPAVGPDKLLQLPKPKLRKVTQISLELNNSLPLPTGEAGLTLLKFFWTVLICMSFDFSSLAIPDARGIMPVRAAAGLAGTLVLGATGWLLAQRTGLTNRASTRQVLQASPASGLEAVSVRPGPYSFLAKPPPGQSQTTALFAYSGLLPTSLAPSRREEAWVYGATLPTGPHRLLATPTGDSDQIVKGELLEFGSAALPDVLAQLDRATGYVAPVASFHGGNGVGPSGVGRGVVNAIRRDGSATPAIWYYAATDVSPSGGAQAKSKKKVIMVTGATDGIGQFTAQQLAEHGYKVLVHGRTKSKVERVCKDLQRRAKPPAQMDEVCEGFVTDLSSLSQVRKMGTEVAGKYKVLHGLLNNAGTFDGDYTGRKQVTVDGNEYSLAVNVLAPFLLTSLLLDNVRRSGEGRVIITSSISMGSGNYLNNLQGWSFRREGPTDPRCAVDRGHRGQPIPTHCQNTKQT
eukprot:g36286.t1